MSENATDVEPGVASGTGSLASRHPRVALALLALPSLLIAIDISVLGVALPGWRRT